MNKDTLFHLKNKQMSDFLSGKSDFMPYRYVFVLTNQCNLSCSFCFQSKSNNERQMPLDIWVSLINELPAYARVTLTGGEPLLYPHFDKIFAKVAERFECNLITNGVFLSKDIIDMVLSYPNFKVLSISIDDIGNRCRGLSDDEWQNMLAMIDYFNEKKRDAILDIKTIIMDENLNNLFNIYKFFREVLKCDTHVMTFLKGSHLQHSDIMHPLQSIFIEDKNRYIYHDLHIICEQINLIRNYNIKNNLLSYCHPKVCSLVSESPVTIADLVKIDGHNFNKDAFEPCLFPHSSIHINYDGNVFPCLSVSFGNVRDKGLTDIVKGKKFKEFKDIISQHALVDACNRCGWLIPKDI